jgi:hypothetical protein
MMNSAGPAFGPRPGTVGLAQRQKQRGGLRCYGGRTDISSPQQAHGRQGGGGRQDHGSGDSPRNAVDGEVAEQSVQWFSTVVRGLRWSVVGGGGDGEFLQL